MPERDTIAVIARLGAEGRALVNRLKAHSGFDVFCDAFERALLDYESFFPSRRAAVPPLDFGGRVTRGDLVTGKTYLLHAPSRSAPLAPFAYLGDDNRYSVTDRSDGRIVSLSFTLRWESDGSASSAFYADFGLEPYSSMGTNGMWHDENWVSDDHAMEKAIKDALARSEADDGDEDDNAL